MGKFDEEMANYIRSWELPKSLESIKDDINFKFDDNEISDVKEEEKGYLCERDNVKFCLYNKKLRKTLFSMDFQWRENNRAFPDDSYPRVDLMFIRTHGYELKRKGIASYYISKLREYAVSKKAKCIHVTVHADVSGSALSQKELLEFYNKRSTIEMPIEITKF